MELLKKIEAVVREAGQIVLTAKDEMKCTRQKTNAADLVTAYDVQVQEFLKGRLLELVEGAIFFGEEEAEHHNPTRGWAFIVDPIDGTGNFVRGLSQSAISVGLAKDGQVEYGVVLDPYKDEMFTAKRGEGAWLNGEPIHVSTRPLCKGLIAMGTSPYKREYWKSTVHMVEQLMDRAADLRRMGAAALDLCALACGRYEVFFEYSLCPWDYAAASLIITEAGGCISTLENEPLALDHNCTVWACNAVNSQVLSELEV